MFMYRNVDLNVASLKVNDCTMRYQIFTQFIGDLNEQN
jgi:hypothetical protein